MEASISRIGNSQPVQPPTICTAIAQNPAKGQPVPLQMPANWSMPPIESRSPYYPLLQQAAELYQQIINSGLDKNLGTPLSASEQQLVEQYAQVLTDLIDCGLELFNEYVTNGDQAGLKKFQEEFAAVYQEFAGRQLFQNNSLDLLLQLAANDLTPEHKALLLDYEFSESDNGPQRTEFVGRLIENWVAGIGGFNGFQEPLAGPEMVFSQAALSTTGIDDVIAENYRSMIFRLGPQEISRYEKMPPEKLKAAYEQENQRYELLPSGNIHKIRAYQRMMDIKLIAWARKVFDLNHNNYMTKASDIVGGQAGLRCATRFESMPAEYGKIAREANYYDFLVANQGAGIVLGDLVENNAFADGQAIFMEDFSNAPPFNTVSILVHEAAHLEWKDSDSNIGPVLQERHSVLHELAYSKQYLQSQGAQLKQQGGQSYEQILQAVAGNQQMVRYYNYIAGFAPDDRAEHAPGQQEMFAVSDQHSYYTNSSHHPAVLFISRPGEVTRIMQAARTAENGRLFDRLTIVLEAYLIAGTPLSRQGQRFLNDVFQTTDPLALMQFVVDLEVGNQARALDAQY
jgi:hypothetical protein